MLRQILAGALLLSFVAEARAADWDEVLTEQGVTVWRREIEGQSIVEFRGRGTVEAPLLNVAAVIRGADRGTEWIANCNQSRFVIYDSALSAVVYHRTESPGPFNDRDVVMAARFERGDTDKVLWVRFFQTSRGSVPVPEDVVRMPKLEGYFKLVALDDGRTEVEYQVQADPGGAIPGWVANIVTKKLPLHTIINLRKQVTALGYEEHRSILESALLPEPKSVAMTSAASGTE